MASGPSPSTIEAEAAFVGGGLAGLGSATYLAQAGLQVVLVEAKRYPFHRVCGEYVAHESWPFLRALGLQPEKLGLPRIRRLMVSAPNGRALFHPLPTGAWGISRYALDAHLAELFRQAGGQLLEGQRAEKLENQANGYRITGKNLAVHSPYLAASYGKRSNLGKPPAQAPKNYVGVKYHIRYPWPEDLIGLHNFAGGYCGISQVEDGRCCLCYLAEAEGLQKAGGIGAFEEQVLMQNRHLREIFEKAQFLWEKPLTISNVQFRAGKALEGGIPRLGDAAGQIAPLTGNGMSLALHSGKLWAQCLLEARAQQQGQAEAARHYQTQWNRRFRGRIGAGRHMQGLFGQQALSNAAVGGLRPFPMVVGFLEGLTHGSEF